MVGTELALPEEPPMAKRDTAARRVSSAAHAGHATAASLREETMASKSWPQDWQW